MKFTMSWLRDHLDTDASAEAVAEALTDAGLEVESIGNAAAGMEAFTICRVQKARKHPNADRLSVCVVETFPNGQGSNPVLEQVVCGAPNARTGLVGVFAPAGTRIPGTGLDLKASEIRGVESRGMLCSERELNISDEHDGIIDLPADAPLGARFVDYFGLDDPIVEIAVTPNRPDALGVRGIARDLAARGLGRLKLAEAASVDGRFRSAIPVSIDEELKSKACPAFFGRVIRGVANGESPDWIQKRLKAVGLRPISALVDITNYVMLDRNRPLHAFDADKVGGGLRVHFAEGGEKVVALDGAEYEFETGMIAISDANGVESIAGIMGGEATGCTSDTVNVFLESALWDPVATAATGRRLKIESDARYRFERGVDPEFTIEGLDLATALILRHCGGEASEIVGDGEIPREARVLELRTGRVESLTGLNIGTDAQIDILESLGFRPERESERIAVTVPSWRPDVGGEADLVEEVARIASLSGLEGAPLRRASPGVSPQVLTPLQKRERAARRALAALGYNECVTYSFVDEDLSRHFMPEGGPVRLDNPISSSLNVMRPNLLPGLLRAAARNQAHGYADLALFEVGPVFSGSNPEDQRLHATGLLVGSAGPREPHSKVRQVDLFDAKADSESVLAAIGASAHGLSRETERFWHPGRSGCVLGSDGDRLAVFGEINPRVLKAAKIKGTAVGFTVCVDPPRERDSERAAREALHVPELQAVERDFAFVVDAQVEASAILRAARSSEFGALFESVSVFDEFAGPKAEEQLGEGKKSLAISVRIQPEEQSFKDAQLEEICADVVKRVESQVGAQLR